MYINFLIDIGEVYYRNAGNKLWNTSEIVKNKQFPICLSSGWWLIQQWQNKCDLSSI